MKIIICFALMAMTSNVFAQEHYLESLGEIQGCTASENSSVRNRCVESVIKRAPSVEKEPLRLMQSTCSAQEMQWTKCYLQSINFLRNNPLPWSNFAMKHAQYVRMMCKSSPQGERLEVEDERFQCWRALLQNPPKLKEYAKKQGCFEPRRHGMVKISKNCEKALDAYEEELRSGESIATNKASQQVSQPGSAP